MARTPPRDPYRSSSQSPTPSNDADLFGLAAAIVELRTAIAQVNTKLGFVIAIGVACIGGGALAAWDLSSKMSDVRGDIGKLEGSIEKSLNEKFDEILHRLPDEPQPSPQKPGVLLPLPQEFLGWMGVEAPSTEKLADALVTTPKSEQPLWIYTLDPDIAKVLQDQFGGKQQESPAP